MNKSIPELNYYIYILKFPQFSGHIEKRNDKKQIGGVSMWGINRRRKYDSEFKREAVRLVLEEGQRASEVERNLGITRSLVSRWVREMKEDPEYAFPGKGKLKACDEEIRKLKRENERLGRERDILKKAVAIFSKDPQRYTRS